MMTKTPENANICLLSLNDVLLSENLYITYTGLLCWTKKKLNFTSISVNTFK